LFAGCPKTGCPVNLWRPTGIYLVSSNYRSINIGGVEANCLREVLNPDEKSSTVLSLVLIEFWRFLLLSGEKPLPEGEVRGCWHVNNTKNLWLTGRCVVL
jgi:hypothetical protein